LIAFANLCLNFSDLNPCFNFHICNFSNFFFLKKKKKKKKEEEEEERNFKKEEEAI
jgi:hypothetical protein